MKKVLFLRHKGIGDNSIEELANTLLQGMPDLILAEFPCASNSFFGMIRNILFAIKQQGDVNHFMCMSNIYVAPFIRGKIIVTHHDMGTLFLTKNKLFRFVKRYIMYPFSLCFVKRIVCISKFTQRETIKEFSCVKHKIIYIYNSYNRLITQSAYSFNGNHPKILHIGTARRKNLSNVIKAIGGLSCHLYIIGRLDDEQQNLLREMQVEYSQEYDIPFERVIEYYKLCDLVTFPSSYEGFGMPIIEAQAIGRPVVTSKIPVIEEIAGNAVCFVDPGNIQSIRNGILKVINNERYREELIARGIENARRFSTIGMINGYKSLYDEIIQH